MVQVRAMGMYFTTIVGLYFLWSMMMLYFHSLVLLFGGRIVGRIGTSRHGSCVVRLLGCHLGYYVGPRDLPLDRFWRHMSYMFLIMMRLMEEM